MTDRELALECSKWVNVTLDGEDKLLQAIEQALTSRYKDGLRKAKEIAETNYNGFDKHDDPETFPGYWLYFCDVAQVIQQEIDKP